MKHITRDGIDVYRIGWWTHHWWPRRVAVHQMITGFQPNFRDPIHRTRETRAAVRRDALYRSWLSLKYIRRPHRPWQAEYDDCRWCRRGWTAAGVRRKAERDLAYQEATGRWAPWVQRRVLRRYGTDAPRGPLRSVT